MENNTISPNNLDRSTNQQTEKKDKTASAVVAAVLLTAVVVGVGVYVWQDRANKQTKVELEQRLSVLEEELQQQSAKPLATSQPLATSAAVDSPLCTAPSVTTEIGSEVYPIEQKYKHLHFLGQIFTAANCSPERVRAVNNNSDIYTLGSRIWLHRAATTALIDAFTSIGFTCSGQTFGSQSCSTWELPRAIPVNELLKLEPFADQFKQDDCVNCG